MKIRMLSLLLCLCMLLSAVAVFPSAAVAQEGADKDASSGAREQGSYIDLYVKDGLVALFDAYSMTAADAKLTEWKPVNLYGKAGYEDYLNLSTAAGAYALSAGKSFEWRAGDGCLKLHRLDVMGGFDAYLNADVIAAQLADTWSVQEVARQSAAPHSSYVPLYEGKVITSLASKSQSDVVGHWQSGVYGILHTTQMFFSQKADSKLISQYMQSTSYNVNNNSSNTKWAANVSFNTDYYVGSAATASKGYTAINGDSLDGYYINDGTMATVERTISQLSKTENAGEYTFEYTMGFRNAVSKGKTQSFKATTTNAAAAAIKSFLLLRDCAESNYSIRIYNKVLEQSELDQNHLADLVAFYGVDPAVLLSMNTAHLSKVVTATVDFPLDDRTKEAFDKNKATLEAAIAKVVDAYANEAEASKMDEYDALYIGASGEKSANGGSLVALYTAYGTSNPSLNIQSGIWFDKIGGNHATVVGGAYSATTNTTGWKVREAGGFGYDLTVEKSTGTKYLAKQQASDNVIVFEPSLVLSPDFTVEYVASFKYLTLVENGTPIGDYKENIGSHYDDFDTPSDTIGLLTNAYTRGGYTDGDTSKVYREVRWMVTPPGYTHNSYGNTYGWNGSLWGDKSRQSDAIFNQTVTRDESALAGGAFEAIYTLYKNTAKTDAATYTTLDVTDPPVASNKKNPYFKDAAGQEFKLFSKAPVSVYAVRVYDSTLTASEMLYNRFIDLCAFAGADISGFVKLDTEKQYIVVDAMGDVEYPSDKLGFNNDLQRLIGILAPKENENLLYVTKGLTFLLAAYDGYSTDYVVADTNKVLWSSGIGELPPAVLEGTGWKRSASGGFTIVKTKADYNGTNYITWKERYGLTLDGAVLPTSSYSVELVANPVGLTEADGTRHIDDHSPTGTFNENGFAIGPLRALQFSCYRPSGNDGQMERRWVYGVGNTPNADSGWKTLVSENYWQGLALEEIVTLRISLEISVNQHAYSIKQGKSTKGFSIATENVITNEEANRMFRLMHGVAGTIFAVRVYDRVISEAEAAQNRMADLVYYYGIDAGFVADIISASGGALESLSTAFADLDFGMDKNDAQELFMKRLTSVWLSASGFSIKKNLTDGLRYYFDIYKTALDATSATGISFELGAVVNIGKNAEPMVDGYGYDYKIVAYDSIMGKESALYTDEDTFAVTVRYSGAGVKELTALVKVRGYIKLTDAFGNETVYYTDPLFDCPESMFEGYYLIDEEASEEYVDNLALSNYTLKRIAGCYSNAFVYVDGNAATGGNGSKEAPFKNFEDAFARCKALLRTVNTPTRLSLVVGDGTYSIYETQELLEADKPYDYSIFTVISESGNAVLKTTVDLDASKFVLEGDNLYSYQLEADENGEYPAFRCLFVNDTMAELALNGSYRVSDETRTTYRTAFHRDFDGIAQLAKDLKDIEGYDFTFIPENYKGRDDLIERFVLYRDQYIAHNDARELAESSPEKLVYGVTATRANDPNCTEEYLNAFNKFVIQFIAARDVYDRGQKLSIKYKAFKDMEPIKKLADFGNNKDDYAVYTAAFKTARDYNYNNRDVFKDGKARLYTGFAVAQDTQYSISKGKLYMPEAMLGDLTPYIEAGKAQMIAYGAKLVAEAKVAYDAAVLAYTNAQAAYDTLLATKAALEALSSYAGNGLGDVLDEKIASAPTDTETDKAILDAYKAVKASLSSGESVALNEQLRALENSTAAFVAGTLNPAKLAVTDAEDAVATAESVNYKANHECRWVESALTLYRMELHHNCYWNFNILHIEGVDYDDYVDVVGDDGMERHVAVYVNQKEYANFQNHDSTGYKTSGRAVFLRNVPMYMDENNEYYYDEASGKIYLYSDTPVSDFEIGYATLDRMFILKNVENVGFENITFTATDDYALSENGLNMGMGGMVSGKGSSLLGSSFADRCAVYVDNGKDMFFRDCSFYNLPCEAIHAERWSENWTVEGCSFENIGGTAVRIGTHKAIGVSDQSGGSWFEGINGARNVSIVNNYFHTTGTVLPTAPILVTKAEDLLISQNTISDCTSAGISVGWDFDYVHSIFNFAERSNARNVEISYNYITDWMTECYDQAAIYLPQQNSYIEDTNYYMNAVHHNTIIFSKKTLDGQGGLSMGIYFDISASNWHCFANVIAEQSYGAHESETDYETYGVTKEEALLKQKRRSNSHYIYLQHIDTQESHNILVEGNYILNVRNTEAEAQHKEVYRSYFSKDLKDAPGRNLVERGTVYVVGVRRIPAAAEEIITACGAEGYKGEMSLIYSNTY